MHVKHQSSQISPTAKNTESKIHENTESISQYVKYLCENLKAKKIFSRYMLQNLRLASISKTCIQHSDPKD